MSSFRKIVLICFSTVLVLLCLLIGLASPLSKYLIEKYDEKYTGRRITIDWAYVNPFTGYIHLSNLRIFEVKSDSVFLTSESVNADFVMHKLFSGTYEISALELNRPKGTAIQNGNKHGFNFNDIIERFSPKKHTGKARVHFSILRIDINEGEFYYYQNTIPVSYFIKHVNIRCDGIRWNSDTIVTAFSAVPGIGKGQVSGKLTVNTKSLDYRLTVAAGELDLGFLGQYLKDISNYGSFTASLDATVKATGNFHHARDLDARGQLVIRNFHFGKNPGEDYAAFSKFTLNIVQLNPINHKYIFDSVLLERPFFKYERYDYLDNIQNLFGKKGSAIRNAHSDPAHFNLILEMADYVEELARNFLQSYYKIRRLEIAAADLEFRDYSLGEEFSVAANPLYMEADSIDKGRERINIILRSGIKPYGGAFLRLSLHPRDSGDFDLQYDLKNIPMAMFNPYLIHYTSFPLNKGTMEVKGSWQVRNGTINSRNHLMIIDPRIAARVRNESAKRLPLPLIMAFIRERSNTIDYEIPVTGSLKSPKFHMADVVTDLLENIFVKPPSVPYMVRVRAAEHEIENALTLTWEMGQSDLNRSQQQFVRKIADFLTDNSSAHIVVNAFHYAQKEKEQIAFFEAKKKFWLISHNRTASSFNEEDSLYILGLSVKDSLFVRYINRHCNTHLVFTVQEKCRRFVGSRLITKKFTQLVRQRESAFRSCFKENKTNGRLSVRRPNDKVPFNGFSCFKIAYKGGLPEYLLRANRKMDELNSKAPRKQLRKVRMKTERFP